MAGSLVAGDIITTSAFHEQYYAIGWVCLFLGHISKLWGKDYASYKGNSSSPPQSCYWTSIFILQLWKYASATWAHQNSIVHSSTSEETAAR